MRIYALGSGWAAAPECCARPARACRPAVLRGALYACAALILAGCTSVSAVQVVGAAVNAAMETAGLKQPAGDPETTRRPLNVTLAAGEVLNAADTGESLALVVQVYQLRNATGFSTLSYAQAVQGEGARVLGEDLVAMREVTLLPGKTHVFGEPLRGEVKAIGLVALFRAPAPNRWKFTFDREASEKAGITVGFHGCAMTIGTGELANGGATAASRTLGGVRCN